MSHVSKQINILLAPIGHANTLQTIYKPEYDVCEEASGIGELDLERAFSMTGPTTNSKSCNGIEA